LARPFPLQKGLSSGETLPELPSVLPTPKHTTRGITHATIEAPPIARPAEPAVSGDNIYELACPVGSLQDQHEAELARIEDTPEVAAVPEITPGWCDCRG
jgi:hypothetical protein